MDSFNTQGIRMPRLGFGTFRMQGDVCRAAVEPSFTRPGSAVKASPAVSTSSPSRNGNNNYTTSSNATLNSVGNRNKINKNVAARNPVPTPLSTGWM